MELSLDESREELRVVAHGKALLWSMDSPDDALWRVLRSCLDEHHPDDNASRTKMIMTAARVDEPAQLSATHLTQLIKKWDDLRFWKPVDGSTAALAHSGDGVVTRRAGRLPWLLQFSPTSQHSGVWMTVDGAELVRGCDTCDGLTEGTLRTTFASELRTLLEHHEMTAAPRSAPAEDSNDASSSTAASETLSQFLARLESGGS
jgi:hypothetical protein